MSAIIQTLNDWGENFFSFAWPMLWQSSLLIALVFAFDALFARRVRAAVRYALWIAVLVKLLLPPTLALPTSAAWWLWPAKPALVPVMSSEVVTFDGPVTMPPVTVPQTATFVPPPPELSVAGWTVLALFVVGAALLLWLALRWLRVAAKVHCVASFDDLAPALEEVGQLSRLRRTPRLKQVEDVQSPAVYGLFRPVILLPCALVEKLSARQLRAVLLHEAIHLRRGDVWMNCVQTLLQIAYWWHPLLWLANARIRRLREEAVDDAVMLALRHDADTYAPTLLEVAKFSFRRPFGLALVGILETRSALRRRIERLVDFRPPRKAGLTFLSLCGILAFCAVTLPMGCGRSPERTTPKEAIHKNHWPDPNFEGIRNVYLTARFLILDDDQLKSAVPSLADNPGPTLLSPDETTDFLQRLQEHGARSFDKDWSSGIFQPQVSGAWQYYEIGGSTNGLNMVIALTNITCTASSELFDGWRIKTIAPQPDWTPMNLNLRALIQDGGTHCQMDLSYPNTGNPALHSEIMLPTDDALVWVTRPGTPGKYQVVFLTPTFYKQVKEVALRYAPGTLTNVLQWKTLSVDMAAFSAAVTAKTGEANLATGFKKIAAKAGVDLSAPKGLFLYNNRLQEIDVAAATKQDLDIVESLVDELAPTIPGAGEWSQPATRNGKDFSEQTKSGLNQALTKEREAAHLELTAQSKVNSLQIHPHPVIDPATGLPVFTPSSSNPTNENKDLKMRMFKVGTNTFAAELGKTTGLQFRASDPSRSAVLKQFFARAGVDLSPPEQLYYNSRLGIIYVYATKKDLDVIERALTVLGETVPMVHIKTRFIEVPRSFFANEVNRVIPTGAICWTGVLANPDFQVVLQEIQQQNGSTELAKPEVASMSGRKTEMRATVTRPTLIDDPGPLPPHHMLDTILNTNLQSSPPVGTAHSLMPPPKVRGLLVAYPATDPLGLRSLASIPPNFQIFWHEPIKPTWREGDDISGPLPPHHMLDTALNNN